LVRLILKVEKWKKKIENPEEILPPFDRALLKLKNLKDSRYLIESNHKEYYSVLTDIIRKYLEEEIHIAATESTTDELLTKLQVFLDAGKLHLSSDVVEELRTVLRKADLVKFAKSKPEDFEAENDRAGIRRFDFGNIVPIHAVKRRGGPVFGQQAE